MAEKVQKQYERGVITDDERRQELIEIWTRATTEVANKMRDNFPKYNPIQMMVGSGARGGSSASLCGHATKPITPAMAGRAPSRTRRANGCSTAR